MCGIAGIYGFEDKNLIKNMTKVLSHRGPDGYGFFFDKDVSLGHRRLAIIDLKGGKQPIHNEDGTIWVICNGEIYNFPELRKNLSSHEFYTDSDTEVIVHLYEEHGLGFIQRLQGMFALALWDSVNRRLILVRDRLGIKPLYYSWDKRQLIFASEIKALLEHVKPKINEKALYRFLILRYTPGEITLLKGIKKLPPGHMIICQGNDINIKKYWDLHPQTTNKSISFYEKNLKEILKESVDMHLISDVPIGAFLSGGIDSSIVVGLMSQLMQKTVKTFSVGFDIPEYSELEYAKVVSEYFNTDHHELIVDSNMFIEILPTIVAHMDEPIADAAAIPTYLISELAREKVKVVLTGEGGDEIFAGYPHYKLAGRERLARYYLTMPQLTKNFIKYVFKFTRYPRYLNALEKADRYYLNFNVAYAEEIEIETNKKGEITQDILDVFHPYLLNSKDIVNEMLCVDIKTWLPEELLMKVDKMTMASSLEARVPYLDHRLVTFCMSIPSSFKIRGDIEKYILRRSFSDLLPRDVLKRKKMGFSVPIEKWRDEIIYAKGEELLKSRFLKRYITEDYIRESLRHKTSQRLLNLLILNIWNEIFIEGQ